MYVQTLDYNGFYTALPGVGRAMHLRDSDQISGFYSEVEEASAELIHGHDPSSPYSSTLRVCLRLDDLPDLPPSDLA